MYVFIQESAGTSLEDSDVYFEQSQPDKFVFVRTEKIRQTYQKNILTCILS